MSPPATATATTSIDFHVLIPARLASTRLPEKVLADLAGRPLIVRVWEQVSVAGAASVHVATDCERIAAAVRSAGGEVVMTGSDHDSGTSRLAEAAATLRLDADAIVVNVQADEPLVPVECLHQLAGLLAADPTARMATLWTAADDRAQWMDPNVVKLVAGRDGRALYFSRAPIPALRDRNDRDQADHEDWPAALARRHVGLYAYRVDALREWSRLPESMLERAESLEQLRALEAGWPIACAPACAEIPPGVDTPADLEAMRERFGRIVGGHRS
ncbi:MAG: 3-deoxy-manno-octulosonate cytidylyltransferase [Wenzhouxiangellaceae bacterium]|nr:3-deoxy-manno-octulosonate cytidylyltransferase [Wenzhouxiangellaceae bacterium]